MILDKRGGGGTPAEGLDAKGSASGIEIEHPRIGHPFTERGKDRATNPVHGWAGSLARSLQGEATG